jgi:hypothetical protein
MEPREVFAERIRVPEVRRVQTPTPHYRGVLEFEDGDRFEFRSEAELRTGTHEVLGTFEEEHQKPIVEIHEIQE